ncbi:MAG: hypothetical protein ACYCVO_15310 [Acidimicrobiales bacterium]
MSTAQPAQARSHELAPEATVTADAPVLPATITAGRAGTGPVFGDDVWDVACFVPRTTAVTRANFNTIADAGQRRTAKEYLWSRINRAVPFNRLSGSTRPMKITSLYHEFCNIRMVLTDLDRAGAARLREVTKAHLEEVLAHWKGHPDRAASLVGTLKHLGAHGSFLSDALIITPWPGRTANLVAGRRPPRENHTPRIPELVMAPLLSAAVFYVETASADLLAASEEIARLEQARAGRRLGPTDARRALEAFIEARQRSGRGIPALPCQSAHKRPGARTSDGVVQAPNGQLIALLAGVHGTCYHRDLLAVAGAELGYEHGGLDSAMSPWPATGRPWRARLDPWSLRAELTQLRTACFIVIAYLSGMRDAEVRELARDCAVREIGLDGRVRHKLRGRVFKDRRLGGDEANWVVLEVVHRAVEVLLQVNDDPTHLFGHSRGEGFELLAAMSLRLNRFAAHAEELFGSPEHPFLLGFRDGKEADSWSFTTRQFRRTLAWHIAHQPFGVVAGARQYKHAGVAVFEGYAGTSASGFAAEVEAEKAAARLDYLEELYRDWSAGGPSAGGAARSVDAELARIHAEFSKLPGTVADPRRLRAMLEHLAVTLHPGVLGDCFYRPENALCAKHGAASAGRLAPVLDACLFCPNARRSRVHLGRLEQARDQARELIVETRRRPLSPLQAAALSGHLDQLDRLIGQASGEPEGRQAR